MRSPVIGGAHIGEEADSNLRHCEEVALARNPVAAVEGDAHPAAHHDPIHQGDIGFRESLDADVELVFLAPEPGRLRLTSGAPEFVELADVATGAERLFPRALHHDPRDGRIAGPVIESPAHLADHAQGQGIERLRPIERDQTGRPLPLADDFALAHAELLFRRLREGGLEGCGGSVNARLGPAAVPTRLRGRIRLPVGHQGCPEGILRAFQMC